MNGETNWNWHEFAAPDELAKALAERVAAELRAAVSKRGTALLAVSGGTTPKKFLRALADEILPWDRVTVTLADERFVPADSDRSNERLVRFNLLRSEAARAQFVGLYSATPSVEEAASAAAARLASAPLPLDAAVLGMGLDGHTASFFPDADNLADLLDPHSEEIVSPVHAQSAGERLTLSLARLVEAGFVALHVEGSAKRDALLLALRENSEGAPPVRSIFSHSANPAQIYWAPNEDELP